MKSPSDVVCFHAETSALRHAQMQAFIKYCSKQLRRDFRDYEQFERFAANDYQTFWRLFLCWLELGVQPQTMEPACVGDAVETAAFFPNVSLNYARCLLEHDDDQLALIAYDQDARVVTVTRQELRRRVLSVAASLADLGVGEADRAAAIAYSGIEAVVACLACAALGASFSTAAPDMEAPATLARFAQIEPTILFAHTHSRAGNHLATVLPSVAAGLPTLKRLITLDDGAGVGDLPHQRLADLQAQRPLQEWKQFGFNHPLFIMFSSGTTGAPKCIVHGAGGTLIEHLKELRLHCDLKPGERLFFQTSCAWMMWNWQLSALACGVTLVLYDAPISHPSILWSLVAQHRVNVFGTNPSYLRMCQTAGYVPRNAHGFSDLRAVLSTGSILYDQQYDWVMQQVKKVPVQSISGGTDIIGCFVLGNPVLPVWRGEAQCRSLGMDVGVVGADSAGIGELVCRNPFPSRPLGFLHDPDGARFHAAYFAQNAGAWTHGDRISISKHGSVRLHGRSDGVLNVRGMRMGTSELYAALHDVGSLAECMAVEQDMPDHPAGARIVLLVVLVPGVVLTNDLVLDIRRRISRRVASAYAPHVIIQVDELPTTHSGKRSETAARDALNGRAVRNISALRNPHCLAAIMGHTDASLPYPEAANDVCVSTTEVVASSWRRVFGIHMIGTGENFFDLGGDSLLALSICTEIERQTGLELPIGSVLGHPTIECLAAHIDSGSAVQRDPCVVMRAGTGPALFLLHSVSGNTFECHALISRLQTTRPVIAVQARGLDPRIEPACRVGEMADDYIAIIKHYQPDGPYALLGYSFGGLLAYDIAVRLHGRGDQTDFVGLIDTDVSDANLGTMQRARFQLGKLKHIARRVTEMRTRGVWRKLRRRLTGKGSGQERELPMPLLRVRQACDVAFMNYKPPPADDVVVTFFRSQERRQYYCEPLLVWRRRVKRLRVIAVRGGHISMMMEPDVAALAAALSACLPDPRHEPRPELVELAHR